MVRGSKQGSDPAVFEAHMKKTGEQRRGPEGLGLRKKGPHKTGLQKAVSLGDQLSSCGKWKLRQCWGEVRD